MSALPPKFRNLRVPKPPEGRHFRLQAWQYPSGAIHVGSTMPDAQDNEERPCLHCMMVELIGDFFAENPATSGEPDTIDTDEVIIPLAKTVADLTCSQNSTVRQQIIETLMREIMEYDAEFRREDASIAVGSAARH
jgi:hypothetical protein